MWGVLVALGKGWIGMGRTIERHIWEMILINVILRTDMGGRVT